MNPKSLFVAALAVAVLAAALLAPVRSSGQAGGEEAALASLLSDVTAQQAAIAENQTLIDARIAKIGDDVRLARIYAGRAR